MLSIRKMWAKFLRTFDLWVLPRQPSLNPRKQVITFRFGIKASNDVAQFQKWSERQLNDATMKRFIAICLLAIVATASARISIWFLNCCSNEVTAVGKRTPKFANAATKTIEMIDALIDKARGCNTLNDWREPVCEMVYDQLRDKKGNELVDFLRKTVSCIEQKYFCWIFWSAKAWFVAAGPGEFKPIWCDSRWNSTEMR